MYCFIWVCYVIWGFGSLHGVMFYGVYYFIWGVLCHMGFCVLYVFISCICGLSFYIVFTILYVLIILYVVYSFIWCFVVYMGCRVCYMGFIMLYVGFVVYMGFCILYGVS